MTAPAPKPCFSYLKCTNLMLLSSASSPHTARCGFRYESLAAAKTACLANPVCGGIVHDNGLFCAGQLKSYELRSGTIHSDTTSLCVNDAWQLTRNHVGVCPRETQVATAAAASAATSPSHRRRSSTTGATSHADASIPSAASQRLAARLKAMSDSRYTGSRSRYPPTTRPAPTASSIFHNRFSSVLAVNMREYFQGNWNMGTHEGIDCARMRRVGPAGDGGKMVCYDAIPPASQPCFVLSVGVGGAPNAPPDFRFEIDLHRRFPHCKVHVYDGTNFGRGEIRNAPSFVTFYPENFLPSTYERYRGQRVDVFKIDCEGCEFQSIKPFLSHVETEQLMLEVHGGGRHRQVQELMTGINRTHGIFYREPNIQHSDGTCIEFAFLRRRADRVRRTRRVL